MDMERRLRGVWKTVSEAPEPFFECVATSTHETIVASARYSRLSRSSTADRQQWMVDGVLALVHSKNADNSDIEAFVPLVSLKGVQRMQRKRKKQCKKNKLAKNPHITKWRVSSW